MLYSILVANNLSRCSDGWGERSGSGNSSHNEPDLGVRSLCNHTYSVHQQGIPNVMSQRLNPENADNHTFMMTGLLGELANTTAGMDSDRLSWATIPATEGHSTELQGHTPSFSPGSGSWSDI